MLTGSFARGDQDETSDVDVHVLHREEWWQKREFDVEGRVWELIVAPPAYYLTQLEQRVPVMINILWDARILWDEDGVAARLIAAARARPKVLLEDPPKGLESLARHRPIALLCDLEAFRRERDSGGFGYVAGCLVDLAVTFWTRSAIGFLDAKQRYRAVQRHHPELHRALEVYERSTDLDERTFLLRRVIDIAYASSGGVSESGTTERVPWENAARFMR